MIVLRFERLVLSIPIGLSTPAELAGGMDNDTMDSGTNNVSDTNLVTDFGQCCDVSLPEPNGHYQAEDGTRTVI